MTDAREIVLLPGAWMGAWAWQEVSERLQAAGLRPHALTLPGLDGRWLASDVGLDDHVAFVTDYMTSCGIRNAVLVGHSYSGFVAGLVADRTPGRVRHVVHIASFLPHEGHAVVDALTEARRQAEAREIKERGGWWPPPSVEDLSRQVHLTAAQRSLLLERFVPHPGRTVTEPATLTGALADQRSTYVVCSSEPEHAIREIRDVQNLPTWSIVRLDVGHFPMVTHPEVTADVIVQAAWDAWLPPALASGLYRTLEIEAQTTKTTIWLIAEDGQLVERANGMLHTRVAPGRYVVRFGDTDLYYPVSLASDSRLTQRSIESGPLCDRPAIAGTSE